MPEEEIETTEEGEEPYGEVGAPITPGGSVSFPWFIFFAAILFDIIEFFIPLLLPLFGLIMGFWQKMYVPKTDPLMSFFLSKIADVITLGILPSSVSIVIFAYIKKRAAAKSPAIKLPKPSAQAA